MTRRDAPRGAGAAGIADCGLSPAAGAETAGTVDIPPLARALIAANPDRILWGTDWPHTDSARQPGRPATDVNPFQPIDDGLLLNQLPSWAPERAIRQQILVDNPARLYGFLSWRGSGGQSMRIHNLYVDASGETHFRDIEVEWVEERRAGKLSRRLPANGIIFRETAGDYDLDWHPAPRRQYIINLDAGVRITASDGESRVIGAGEVILVEDTTGKGHLSQAVHGQLRHSIFVPID